MPGKPRRPTPVTVEPVRARAVRGPHRDGSGRWYWLAVTYPTGQKGKEKVVWRGWADRSEITPILADIIANHGLIDSEPKKADVKTVQDLLEAWLGSRENASDLEANTKRASRSSARRLVGPPDCRTALSSILLTQLDRRHLEHYRDTSTGAVSTVSRDLKTLRSAWLWGRDIGLAPDRSLPRLRRSSKQQTSKPVYTRYTPTESEVAAVMECIRRPYVRRAVLLLYATGGRISEITSLRWGAVAPYDREFTIRGVRLCDLQGVHLDWDATDAESIVFDGKGDRPREVQLHPDVAAEVASWRPSDADPLDGLWGVSADSAKNGIRQELVRASEHLGLPRLSPNGLRRAAERVLYRTRNIDVAASIMGHSPETAIRTYRQVTGEERASLVAEAGLGIPKVTGRGEVVAFPSGRSEE